MNNNLKVWGRDIDNVTMLQAERTARLPILAGYVALMPDAHFGKGSTIGSVIPTTNAIIPSAVGVDVGCGVLGVETNLTSQHIPSNLSDLVLQFGRSNPSGVG